MNWDEEKITRVAQKIKAICEEIDPHDKEYNKLKKIQRELEELAKKHGLEESPCYAYVTTRGIRSGLRYRVFYRRGHAIVYRLTRYYPTRYGGYAVALTFEFPDEKIAKRVLEKIKEMD